MKDLIDQFKKLGFIEKAILTLVFVMAPFFLALELYNAYRFIGYLFN